MGRMMGFQEPVPRHIVTASGKDLRLREGFKPQRIRHPEPMIRKCADANDDDECLGPTFVATTTAIPLDLVVFYPAFVHLIPLLYTSTPIPLGISTIEPDRWYFTLRPKH